MVSFNIFKYILLLLVVGCFGSKNQVEVTGLNQTSDSDQGTGARSVISALGVEDDSLIITGSDLDLIEGLSLYSDENPEGLTSFQVAMPIELRIIFQSPTKIIAAGNSEDLSLYFDSRYDLIRRDFNGFTEDVFPFVVMRQDESTLEGANVNSDISIDSESLQAFANDKDVVIYSATLGEWSTGLSLGN